jgi:hypothetical protein
MKGSIAVATAVSLAAAVLLAGVAAAQDPGKPANLEDGLKAAKKSGKPLLLVTSWKHGVCNTCDTWHDRVPGDADVAKQIVRFVEAEWQYDGLNGKVIPWTKEHGGTSDDPAVQVFVVVPDTGVVTRAPRDEAFAPGDFAKWLKEQADAFEKTHAATRIAFAAADVKTEVAGTTTKWTCAAIDAAKKDMKPVLVYVTRGERADADKTAKAQAAASRKLEKSLFDSDQAAKAAEGWTLLKLDVAEADQLAYAKLLGADRAPALLALVPGEEKPQAIDLTITGEVLAFKLKKLAPKK